MGTIHGKNGVIYLQGSGANAVIMSEATDFTIDIDYDTAVDSAFGDSWETLLKGIQRWSGSLAGNYDAADTLAFDAATATTSRKIYLYPSSATTTQYYYGNCWPKLSINQPRTDIVKVSGSFSGDGALSKNP